MSVTAADAESMSVELFIHAWCGWEEAQWWERLFASRLLDEVADVEARRSRGEWSADMYAEARRLTEWVWVARECAKRKAPAPQPVFRIEKGWERAEG